MNARVRRTMSTWVFTAGLLLGSASAQRAWYVAPGGSDAANECQDSNAPCATISHAMSRIVTNAYIAGDTLHLAQGVYTEAGLTIPRNIQWVGAGPDLTIVQAASLPNLATNRVLSVPLGVEAHLRGLTIRNGHAPKGADAIDSGGAGGSGGGIFNNGHLFLTDVHVVSNYAGDGGSGAAGGPGGDGGGIFSDGFLSASNVLMAFNRSGNGGGGALTGGRGGNGWGLHNSGIAQLDRVAILDNIGGNGGAGGDEGGAAGHGGIWTAGQLMMLTSTVDGNLSGAPGAGTNGPAGLPGFGGGIWADFGSTSVLAHVTVSSNQTVYATAIFSDGARVDLDHALIAGTVAGDIYLEGESVIQNADDAIPSGNLSLLISGVDPRIGERVGPGGAMITRRVKPLSPAINAGDPNLITAPATDQLGAPRIQGGRVDIGAFELQPASSYVGAAGVDGANECRDENYPCATVGHAVLQALPGDEIMLLSGVVQDDAIELDKSLILRGHGMGTSVWQAVSNRLLWVNVGVTSVVRDLTMRGGRAPNGNDAEEGAYGGAIVNEGLLAIERVAFEDNAAGNGGPNGGAGGSGGAIYNNGLLLIAESRFVSNRAGQAGLNAEGGAGGAIYNDSIAHVRDSFFLSNSSGNGAGIGAGGGGGAIFNAGLMSLSRAAFVSNSTGAGSTGGPGGAIFNEDTLGATNITVSGNQTAANASGGGIANLGFVSLAHATIAFNSAANAGGFDASGPLSAWYHVLVASNVAEAAGADATGIVNSLGWNLVGNDVDLTLTNILTGNLLNVDAGLQALADHGGPTPAHALSAGSAARDSGSPAFTPPPATDQRGFPRVIPPRIDIGAFEAPLLDSDGDELPDYWEIQYGLDPFDPGLTNSLSGALADADGDHVNNFEEYIAGTSPTNMASVFRISGISVSTSLWVRFPSVTGRLYSLQHAPLGASLSWSNVAGQVDLAGNGATVSVSHSQADAHGAYRVTVRLPPPGN